MKDGFLTLEDGDSIERNYAEWIRQTIPLYETIWARYIGHDGNGQSLPIPGLPKTLQRDREKFSQAYYSAMVALIHLRDIRDDYQTSLGRVNSVSDYLRLQRDITSFMCHVGRVRDLVKKMDSALHLGDEVRRRFSDFYQKRNNILHGLFPAQRIDSEGLVSIVTPGGVSASDADWLDESSWSEAEHKRFVYAADFVRETFERLLKEFNAVSSRFLSELATKLPGFMSAAAYKLYGRQLSVVDRTPISGSLIAPDNGVSVVSGCSMSTPRKRRFEEPRTARRTTCQPI